jgi:hypothetical protein
MDGFTYKLLRYWHLVELQLVNLGGGTAQQHGGCDQGGRLHGERQQGREGNTSTNEIKRKLSMNSIDNGAKE